MDQKENPHKTYVIPARFSATKRDGSATYFGGRRESRSPNKAFGDDIKPKTFGNDTSWSTFRNDRGLTLLELILALTILSFILWASSSLGLSAIRLLDFFVSDEIRLQNELRYVFYYLEGDLRSEGKEFNVECDAAAGAPCKIQMKDVNDHTKVEYRYSLASQEMVRIAEGLTTVISKGTLTQKIKDGAAQPIFEAVLDSNHQPIKKLVQVNLSAQSTRITLPGISETIMLRGVSNS